MTGQNNNGIGAEFVDGSILRNLTWKAEPSHLFEEFWSSTTLADETNSTLIIGNNGYVIAKPANLLPAPLGFDGSWVPRGQRPALFNF